MQIAYLFEVEGPSSSVLQPASKGELLAALLGVLRDTSWARAVGCLAEPAFMLPITCATALKRNILTSQVSAWLVHTMTPPLSCTRPLCVLQRHQLQL